MEHLENTRLNGNIAVAYTYCVYNQERQTAANFLASLLLQFARQVRTMNVDMRSIWHKHRETPSPPIIEELVQLLKTLSNQFSKAFVLVDALDEFPEVERGKLVSQLTMLAPAIKVLVTSRGLPSIQSLFSTAGRMEIPSQEEDMRTALAARIEEEGFLKASVKQDPRLHDTIIETIIRRAKGMFLVAELHVTALSQEDNIRDLHEKLESLPAEISDTYTQSLARIKRQNRNQAERARQVLLWSAHAFRPLRVRELQQALAVRPDDTVFVHGGEPSIETLVSSCMGLVIIDKEDERIMNRNNDYANIRVDVVRFVHYTAQEFFEHIRIQEYPDGHHKIAESCLLILSLSDFDIKPGLQYTRRDHVNEDSMGCLSLDDDTNDKAKDILFCLRDSIPVVRYASQNWGNHARLALEAVPSSSLQAAIRRFLQRPTNLVVSTWNLPLDSYDTFHRGMSALHLLAYFGIPSVEDIAFWILQEGEVDIRDLDGDTPLHFACRNGHVNVIKMLLERGADKNAQNGLRETPLSLAVVYRRKEVVKLLLEVGVDMTDIINCAIICRSEDTITQLLLESTTDRHVLEEQISSGLHSATDTGQESTVRLLLNAHQRFDLPQEWKSWALTTALWNAGKPSNSKITLVELLLDKGADPNFEADPDFDDAPWTGNRVFPETPLSWAAGSIEAVKLLVQRGAVISLRDSHGCTPLHSRFITLETAGFFVAGGVDIGSRDCRGRTPLHKINDVPVNVISFLLNHHAEIDAQDEAGLTPLMVAVGEYGFLTDDQCASRIEYLLQAGANLNIRDNEGHTPLHHAVFTGHPLRCEILMEYGTEVADPSLILQLARIYGFLVGFRQRWLPWRSYSDNSGQEHQAHLEQVVMNILNEIDQGRLQANKTFLNVCLPCELGFTRVIKSFLGAGAEVRTQWWSKLLNMTFEYASILEFGEGGPAETEVPTATQVPRAIEVFGTLPEHGLPVNTSMGSIGTALCKAAKLSSLKLAAFSIEKGADVELGGESGSPLMIAVCGGYPDESEQISALLLDYKANVNKAWESPIESHKCGLMSDLADGIVLVGLTALHMCAASMWTSASTVALLLHRGANLEAVTSSGETPLILAVKCGRFEMVETLLEMGAETAGIISVTEEDRMSNSEEYFLEALQMVREAHEEKIAEK